MVTGAVPAAPNRARMGYYATCVLCGQVRRLGPHEASVSFQLPGNVAFYWNDKPRPHVERHMGNVRKG